MAVKTATQSFYESLTLESDEELKLIEGLIDEADASLRSPVPSDMLKRLEKSNRLIEEGFFERV
jgi:hypothetical protein